MIASISQQIKEYAHTLGFDACGICRADAVDAQTEEHVHQWLAKGYNADMHYMARNADKRCDPRILVEGARSVICVALNYYPQKKQPAEHPQFAYYAYGKDYHDVMRDKLQLLFDFTKRLVPSLSGRVFCDTAPMLDRYWAVQAGIGFIGKNSLLIIPKKGSYFFLGEVVVDIDLDCDTPIERSCGNCTRCMDACPTQAIVAPKVIDARRCISYQTIENKGDIDEVLIPKLTNRYYGCDICQLVCPYNQYARPHHVEAFEPSEVFLDLSYEALEGLTVEQYQQVFKGSAVKRAKYSGLKRNLAALKMWRDGQ